MGEAAEAIKTPKLSELIEKISIAGKMTREDQNLINEAARTSIQNMDLAAIKHLTELIRAGVVKVVQEALPFFRVVKLREESFIAIFYFEVETNLKECKL